MPSAFRIAREKSSLTLADAGERIAEKLGDVDQADRLRRALTRAENGSEVRWTDDELAAVRELYAVGDNDLASPVFWALFRDSKGQFVALANHLLLFTSPEAAFTARGALSAKEWVAHSPQGVEECPPVALFASEVARTLAVAYGQGLPERLQRAAIATDPGVAEITMLIVAENAMEHPEPAAREGAVEALQRAAVEGSLDAHFSLEDVLRLEHRRVQQASPDNRQAALRRQRHLLEGLMAVAKRELDGLES